jgi:hypothetical protein
MRKSPIARALAILFLSLTASLSMAFGLGADGVDCFGTPDAKPSQKKAVCQTLILPSNHNNLAMSVAVTVRSVAQCLIQNGVSVTFGYARLTHNDPQVQPGPNFALAAPPKGIYTDVSFELQRISTGEPGEIVFTITLEKSLLVGTSYVVWQNFQIDGGEDISGSIPPALLGNTNLPSKPVLAPPSPILGTSVQANWFPNPADENVTSYLAIITDSSTEVSAAEVFPPTLTAILDGLQPGSDYELRLLAVNGHGKGDAATVRFATRFDRPGSMAGPVLEHLSRDWNPSGETGYTLQGAVSSPADINLDGRVNAEDVLMMIQDHLQRVR